MKGWKHLRNISFLVLLVTLLTLIASFANADTLLSLPTDTGNLGIYANKYLAQSVHFPVGQTYYNISIDVKGLLDSAGQSTADMYLEIWSTNESNDRPAQFLARSNESVNGRYVVWSAGTEGNYSRFYFSWNFSINGTAESYALVFNKSTGGTAEVYLKRTASSSYSNGSVYISGPAWANQTAVDTPIIVYATPNASSGAPPGNNLTISAHTLFFNTTLLNFSALINGTTFNSNVTTGIITTQFNMSNNTIMNITLSATNHTATTYEWQFNQTLNAAINYSYFKLNVTAFDIAYNQSLAVFNLTINGTTYEISSTTFSADFPYHSALNVTLNTAGYSKVVNLTTLTPWINRINFSADPLFYKLNVTAYQVRNLSQIINSFTIIASGSPGVASSSTTTGSLQMNLNKNLAYMVQIDAPGYALLNQSILLTTPFYYLNFTLNETNSVTINISDENTLLNINPNISVYVTFSSNISSFVRNTSVSSLYLSGIEPAEYTIQFNASGYAQRYYTLTINNRSSSNLHAYLVPSTSPTTTLTIRDDSTAGLMENVLTTMYRYLNGSWTPVESKLSDITGTAGFSYVAGVNYRFLLSKNGYENLLFYLNPIVYSSYDVLMLRTTSLEATQDFDLVGIIMGPETYQDSVATNFTFLIQSPSGVLTSYGYTLTFPGGTATSSGVNAVGSQLTSLITISGATNLDRLQVDYYYINTIDGLKNFTAYYPITTGVGNYTMMGQADKHYGMGLFERLFWLTIILIICVGVMTTMGKPLLGGLLGMLVLGLLTYTGFIELWLGLIPILLGLIYLSSQGGR